VLPVPGDDAGAVVEVAGVRQGGERPHRVVAGELRQALHEVIQLVQVSAFIWTQRDTHTHTHTHTINTRCTSSNRDIDCMLCVMGERVEEPRSAFWTPITIIDVSYRAIQTRSLLFVLAAGEGGSRYNYFHQTEINIHRKEFCMISFFFVIVKVIINKKCTIKIIMEIKIRGIVSFKTLLRAKLGS